MEGRENGHRGRLTSDRDSRSGRLRLFFALWPDEKTRAALETLSRSLHQQCGGRRVPVGNIHLTLAFLGDVPGGFVPALEQMAGSVQGAAIDLALNVVHFWRHNRIVWIGTRHCPRTLHCLHSRIAGGLEGLGLRAEARDFAPHITVLRKAERAPVPDEFSDIEWRASRFVLVRSAPRSGAVAYDVIGTWPLAGNDPSP